MDKVRTFTVAEVQGRIDKFLASVCTDTLRSELKNTLRKTGSCQ